MTSALAIERAGGKGELMEWGPGPVRRIWLELAFATAIAGIFLWVCVSSAAAACPNEAIREAQVSAALPGGTVGLPDCMALEMVSPPRKGVNGAAAPIFSRDGQRVLFRSQAALGDTEGLQQAFGDLYVASRGESGWVVSPTSPPRTGQIVQGGPPVGGPYGFAPDFERWDSLAATQAQATGGVFGAFQGGLDGSFTPLSPLLVPIDNSGTTELGINAAAASSAGTSADLSTMVFNPLLPSSTYFEEDPSINLPLASLLAPGEQNNYIASTSPSGQPSVALLARDKGGVVYGGQCGVHLGGGVQEHTGTVNQGAIAADGSRIYFSARTAQPADERCGARGQGNTTAGSTQISEVSAVEGSGTVTSGSVEVTDLRVPTENEPVAGRMSSEFLVGQTVAGEGIPNGTKITAVSPNALQLSVPATVTATNITLAAGSAPFAVGEAITGEEGTIPSGATITAVSGRTITISSPASKTTSGKAFSALYPIRILKRLETAAGPKVTELLEGEASFPGDDLYQGASLDGTKVYLDTSRSLVASDQDAPGGQCSAEPDSSSGCDLYLYDSTKPASDRLIQVSVGGEGDQTPGEGANVLGVVAISADGSHVYFVAEGMLTTRPNPVGSTPVAGEPNLYLYDEDAGHPSGHLAFVATLSPNDKDVLWGFETSFANGAQAVPMLGTNAKGAEVGGDGHVLVFASKAAVTREGSAGPANLFRFDADTEVLERVSSAAAGGGEFPSADVAVASTGHPVPPNTTATQWRWVSEDGQTIVFSSAEPLIGGVGGGTVHAYIWRNGVLSSLPEVGEPPTVSAEGDEVAFETIQPLLPQDGDTAGDIYVARVDGGFSNPAVPHPCDPLEEGSCRASAIAPPTSSSATAMSYGPGNPKPMQCRKGMVRKRGRCVKPHHMKKRPRRAKSQKRRHQAKHPAHGKHRLSTGRHHKAGGNK